MIKPNQLPIEVMNEFHAALLHGESYVEAFVAALNAWPGVAAGAPWIIGVKNVPSIILPLPQEASDE